MIKEFKTIISVYGQKKKVAIINCDSCHEDFEIAEVIAMAGRKYCSKECSDNGRGITSGIVVKIKK